MSKIVRSATVLSSDEERSDRQRWDARYATQEPEYHTQPTAFVASCLPQLPRRGYALDVAAGTGRNSAALAAHGLGVEAIDVSWLGLHRALQLARSQRVRIQPIVLDLTRNWLPSRRYDVVVNSFFLLRELIPAIKQVLKPGGWAVFETFTLAQYEISPHRFRSREHLLKPGELHQLFDDFLTISYWEGVEEDRATARLLARKSD
jgi:SAM-dependent methyltransferase